MKKDLPSVHHFIELQALSSDEDTLQPLMTHPTSACLPLAEDGRPSPYDLGEALWEAIALP